MFDAQFSMARIVKPFANFEARYQGNSAGFPIGFPGVLDRLAGQNGYDPFLLAAMPMPIGGGLYATSVRRARLSRRGLFAVNSAHAAAD